MLLVAGAWWLAWSLRFEQRLGYYDRYLDWSNVLLVVALKLPVFALSGFYNRWWRFVSTRDMWTVTVRGVALASIPAGVPRVHALRRPPRERPARRLVHRPPHLRGARLGLAPAGADAHRAPAPGRIVARGKEAIVVGAGDAGQLVIKEMLRNPALGYTPIGLVDDDPRKRNLRLAAYGCSARRPSWPC